jgi:hypothetical protein
MTAPFTAFDPNVGDRMVPVLVGDGVPDSTTFAGVARKGWLYVDETNGEIYKNTGTQATPVWTELSATVGDIVSAASLAVSGDTDAASAVTGTLKTAGGLGVAKKAYVGTDLNVGANAIVAGATDATSSTSGSLKTAGGLGVAKKAYVGTDLTVGVDLHVGGIANLAGMVKMSSKDSGLTASGTDRATSLVLLKQFNEVSTVGAAAAGVTLPSASLGVPIFVWNNGANSMHVYGAGTDTVDGAAAATGVVLTNAKSAIFYPITGAGYLSMMGIPSA